MNRKPANNERQLSNAAEIQTGDDSQPKNVHSTSWLRSLGTAVMTGLRKGSRYNLVTIRLRGRHVSFENNLFAKIFSHNVLSPLADVAVLGRGLAARFRQAQATGKPSPIGSFTLAELPAASVNYMIATARLSWSMWLGLAAFGLWVFAHGAFAGVLMARINVVLMSLLMMGAGVFQALRSARDCQSLLARRSIPWTKFLDQIDRHWCPWPAETAERRFAVVTVGLAGTSLLAYTLVACFGA